MASHMDIPQSIEFSRHWQTPVEICEPPGAPMTSIGAGQVSRFAPGGRTIVGDIDVKRRFPGARLPARPGRGSNTAIQPLNMNPRESVMTPEGIPKL